MHDVPPLRLVHAADADALVVDAKQLARLLGCGLRTLRAWDSSGKLPAPIRIGRCVRWRIDEIRTWLDAGCPNRELWMRIKSASLK
jgi:excisionase family DNA binding protein